MSDTPRTDKNRVRFSTLCHPEDAWWVHETVSAQLERELNAANDRIKRLEEWKESAMAVEREWNPNSLSKMLGGQLGESQRVVIMREVPKLQERIKRLEEAGDAMCSEFKAFCPLGSKTRDKWRKAKEAKP
jgi:hypothetical protein